eukprot:TRINITY_DN89_c0_g1_i1.p1 TRINITY_DN89_c0_g1~~TRINITY_DN89_c0_g1_i1.p1  ORF type:complete len:324 (+),score=75.24 TRINITY_DN89_c0_g1_i1:170-1141(+)
MSPMIWIVSGIGIAIGLSWIIGKKVFGKKSELWIGRENVFWEEETKQKKNFPNLLKDDSLSSNRADRKTLSVVVPAFNEQDRLSIMLDETIEHLSARKDKDSSFSFEIIVVDDGSKDNTSNLSLQYAKTFGSDIIRVLTLSRNRGKGGALRRGFICARGDLILMADADGATKFSDYDRLESELKKITKNGHGATLGSRAHLQQEAVAKRSIFRNVLMWGFHLLINVVAIRGIKDTQCGFKLFTRKTAKALFPHLHVERWAFDIELILLAQRSNIPLSEVAVNWTEIPGSKLSPAEAAIQMFRDVLRIRVGYLFGFWKIDSHIY